MKVVSILSLGFSLLFLMAFTGCKNKVPAQPTPHPIGIEPQPELPDFISLGKYSATRKQYSAAQIPFHLDPNLKSSIQNGNSKLKTEISNLKNRYLYTDFSGQKMIRLEDDYNAAEKVISEFKTKKASAGTYSVNLSFISADPYLVMHQFDVNSAYATISDAEMMQVFAVLKVKADKFLPGESANLKIIEDRALENPLDPAVQNFRKRLQRLYDTAVERTRNMEILDGYNNDHVKLLAVSLGQSVERCVDGLGDGLYEIEQTFFSQDRAANFADFISRVLTDYKMDFIAKHADLWPGKDEVQTTAKQILRQRMLVSMALRGSHAEVQHALIGAPGEPLVSPSAVMKRFLLGEEIQLNDGPKVHFEPYDVQQMIERLQESRVRGFKKGKHKVNDGKPALTSGLMGDLIIKGSDDVLRDDYAELFSTPEDSKFFLPSADSEPGNIQTTDAFWLYLLERYGYIVRN